MKIAFRIMAAMILIAAAVKADGPPNDEIKCGNCPCGTTCSSSPPPPSPPPPSPPPPKKPTPVPGVNCPPPPICSGCGGGKAPPNYIYITGPPGDIYPVVQSVSSGRRSFIAAPVVMMVAYGLLRMVNFV